MYWNMIRIEVKLSESKSLSPRFWRQDLNEIDLLSHTNILEDKLIFKFSIITSKLLVVNK